MISSSPSHSTVDKVMNITIFSILLIFQHAKLGVKYVYWINHIIIYLAMHILNFTSLYKENTAIILEIHVLF